MSRIQAVILDLGGTLMHARDPWEPVEARADQALVQHLRAHGFSIPPDFAAAFRQRLAAYHLAREQSLIETTYLSVLREVLAVDGYLALDESVIRSALDALYAVTEENWVLEKDALLTLKMLESQGCRLGMVSNAGDDKDVMALAGRFGLKPYFDFILTSAACGYRKPHPRIFELALAHWDYSPPEVAMVGDTLDADILGANKAGLYSIWITRRARDAGEPLPVEPDVQVDTLIEIPNLLASLT